MIFIAGLAVDDAERDTGNIRTLGDAIWWAFVTMTTVGYGDHPITVISELRDRFIEIEPHALTLE